MTLRRPIKGTVKKGVIVPLGKVSIPEDSDVLILIREKPKKSVIKDVGGALKIDHSKIRELIETVEEGEILE
jgi:predicted DNA-binding antitoxin AbrB/MazE fold protein